VATTTAGEPPQFLVASLVNTLPKWPPYATDDNPRKKMLGGPLQQLSKTPSEILKLTITTF